MRRRAPATRAPRHRVPRRDPGAVPINKRIHDFVLGKIISGEWPPEHRLPSEHELKAVFRASRMTVRQGLQSLCREGVLKSVQGLGTFVSRPNTHLTILKVQDIAEEIRSRGHRHSSLVVKRVRRPSTLAESARFRVRPGAPLFHCIVMHFEDEAPLEVEDRLVNPALAPNFMHADLVGHTAFAYLMSLYPYPEGEHVIRAIRPTTALKRWLRLRPGEPCLELERTTSVRGQVVTIVRLINPGFRYAIHGAITHS